MKGWDGEMWRSWSMDASDTPLEQRKEGEESGIGLSGVQHLASKPLRSSKLPFFHHHSSSEGGKVGSPRPPDSSLPPPDLRRGSKGPGKYSELVEEPPPTNGKKLLRTSVKKETGLKRRSRQSCPNIPADLSTAIHRHSSSSGGMEGDGGVWVGPSATGQPFPPSPTIAKSSSDEWHTIEEVTGGKEVRGSSSLNSTLVTSTPKDFITLDFLPLRLAQPNQDDWVSKGWDDVETIPALENVTTAQAFSGVLEKRGLCMESVSIWLTNSKTPLPAASLKCSSFALGGQKLCVKPGERGMPLRKISVDSAPTPASPDPDKRKPAPSANVRKASFAEKAEMLEMMERLKAEGGGAAPLPLEESWKSLVRDPDSLSRQRAAQQEALWELVVTEKEHIEKLGLMGEVQERLNALNAAGLLTEVSPTFLLRNIRELERANRSFWATAIEPMLAAAREDHEPLSPVLLEPGFDAMPAWAAPYTDFCLHHLGMDYYIMKSVKSLELFREWMAWIEAQDSMRRLHLKDLLAAPMQRLTKYPLLLKAVLKNTADEADRASLLLMIQRANETATRLNLEFSNKHNLEMLRNISATIDSYEAVETANEELERVVRRLGTKVDLSSPMPFCGGRAMRRVWQKGELKLKDGPGKTDVLCLLLTDMFLVCKADKQRKATGQPRLRVIRPPYHIQNIRVGRLLESREGAFSFVYLNEFALPTAAAAFTALSHEEAQKWVEAFENALKEFRHARSLADVAARTAGAPVSTASAANTAARLEGEMAERRRRRLSVGNVLIDQHRPITLRPTASTDQENLLDAVSPTPPSLIVHRKSSSMDSSTVHAASAAGNLLNLEPGIHLLDQDIPAEARRSRSSSGDTGRPESPATPRRQRFQSRSPSPVRKDGLRAPSPSGTLTPGHGSSETLVPERLSSVDSSELNVPPESFRPRIVSPAPSGRRVVVRQVETEEPASPPFLLTTEPTEDDDDGDEEVEDGSLADIHEGGSPSVGGTEKSRRFEKRYHTADGIEALKPKNTTYPAGILKRFSWNITNAMNQVTNGPNPTGKCKVKPGGEWRKASTMSSDSFCSSSGVSSSSSQLAVNEELPEPPTPVPSDQDNSPLGVTHVSTICVNEAGAGEEREKTLRISLPTEPPPPPSCPPPALPEVPKIETQAPTPPMERTTLAPEEANGQLPSPKVPNRDDLLKLIMEGQLETSDV